MTEYQRLVRDVAETLFLSFQSPVHGQWRVVSHSVRITTQVFVAGGIAEVDYSQFRTFETVSGGVMAYNEWNPPRVVSGLDMCVELYRDVCVPDSDWGRIVEYSARVARVVLAGAEAPGCPVCGAPPSHLAV